MGSLPLIENKNMCDNLQSPADVLKVHIKTPFAPTNNGRRKVFYTEVRGTLLQNGLEYNIHGEDFSAGICSVSFMAGFLWLLDNMDAEGLTSVFLNPNNIKNVVQTGRVRVSGGFLTKWQLPEYPFLYCYTSYVAKNIEFADVCKRRKVQAYYSLAGLEQEYMKEYGNKQDTLGWSLRNACKNTAWVQMLMGLGVCKGYQIQLVPERFDEIAFVLYVEIKKPFN